MKQTVLVTVTLALTFLIIGYTQPQAVILDAPFGLFFYALDKIGTWEPGPRWIREHGFLTISGALMWPLLCSAIAGFGLGRIVIAIYSRGNRKFHVLAIVLVIVVLLLILSIRVDPLSHNLSLHGYMFNNY